MKNPKQNTDTRETFAQYLARVGSDWKESGYYSTCQDYAQASARIRQLESELRTVRNCLNKYAHLSPGNEVVIVAADAVLAESFSHLNA